MRFGEPSRVRALRRAGLAMSGRWSPRALYVAVVVMSDLGLAGPLEGGPNKDFIVQAEQVKTHYVVVISASEKQV